MTHSKPGSGRLERTSDQPLAEINKSDARERRPDPERGKHGPLAGETGDRPVRKGEGSA